MSPPPVQTGPAWLTRRLMPAGAVVIFVAYVAVFLADGSGWGLGMVVDAIANTVSAVISALPVIVLCARVRWDRADRWWFPVAHLVGGAAFLTTWYFCTALLLGVGLLLRGKPFIPFFLHGPALHWQLFTAVVLYLAIAGACYVLQASRAAHHALAERHAAEMGALRAQLDPHLLFNTLHSLLELIRSGDTRADEAVDRFARVVRYATAGRTGHSETVPLEHEWAMIEDYAALELLRLGSRITITFDLDADARRAVLPALSLQPLLENALRHGVAPRPGPGCVALRAHVARGRVHLRVADDGLGVHASTHGSGIGLDLVRRRLLSHFGDALEFSAGPGANGTGWNVVMSFPAAPR